MPSAAKFVPSLPWNSSVSDMNRSKVSEARLRIRPTSDGPTVKWEDVRRGNYVAQA